MFTATRNSLNCLFISSPIFVNWAVCSFLRVCVLSYVQLYDFMDCNLPSSSIQWNFPGKILEWVAISYSRSSRPRDQT